MTALRQAVTQIAPAALPSFARALDRAADQAGRILDDAHTALASPRR
ncbi:hypothetical protein [Streptomyces radicis]|nr:hypothetical protein [Streptomyces radicis]